MNKQIIYSTLGIAILVAMAFIPVTQKRILTRGLDAFEGHRAVFNKHILSQELITQGKVIGAGAILVDMFNSGNVTDVNIEVADATNGKPLATATVRKEQIQDDTFASAMFKTPVANARQLVRVNISAPDASRDNAIGVRYDPDDTLPGTQRLENGTQKNGTFAVQLIEKVPLWKFIVTNATQNPEKWTNAIIAAGGALLIAILGLKPGWKSKPEHVRRAIQLGILIALAALALNTRLNTIPHLKGVSGGDPYNYLYITDSITNFENPFAGVKRLPGYPLILTPSYLSETIDDHTYMRTVSATAGAASLVMLGLLARSLHLPWIIQLAAPALIAWQKDFFWVSMRPEPYTVYTFLLLTSLFLFFNLHTKRNQILFGLVLGYAAMTRQEGFVLAALLLIATFIRWKPITSTTKDNSTRFFSKPVCNTFLRMYLPAFLLVLPFFVHNTMEFGNPIFTPYFKGERLQIIDSYEAFKDASGATWGVIGSMWKSAWDQLERLSLSSTMFVSFFFGSIAWWLLAKFNNAKTKPAAIVLTLLGALALAYTLWLSAASQPDFTARAGIFAAAVIVASSVPFLAQTGIKGTIVWVVLVSQILIATWFHPFSKHYQQSYPLIALMIATTLIHTPALLAKLKRHRSYQAAYTTTTTALLTPFFLVPLIMLTPKEFTPAIDGYNEHTALDTVVYEAVQKPARWTDVWELTRPTYPHACTSKEVPTTSQP